MACFSVYVRVIGVFLVLCPEIVLLSIYADRLGQDRTFPLALFLASGMTLSTIGNVRRSIARFQMGEFRATAQ